MTTFRILPCLPLPLLLLACFEAAPAVGTGPDGSTSGGEAPGEASSTAAQPETSSSTGAPVDTGSGDSGGEPPSGSSSTGSSGGADPSGSTSSDASSTGASESSSSTGEAVDTQRTVFLLPYAGAPMAYEGTAGADALCQDAADEAGVDGTYRAWLSAGSNDEVVDRFNLDGGPFVLVDGTEIAADWDDLTDGTLAAPILVDAMGFAYPAGAVPETYVVTHTDADATSAPGVTPCSVFTADSIIEPRLGDAGAVDENWTQTDDAWRCDNAISGGPSLYCIEQ